MKVRCHACGHVVDADDTANDRLMDSIAKWINYIVALHLRRGETASVLRQSPNCPPCPNCRAEQSRENIT